jgi:hypothetical protein
VTYSLPGSISAEGDLYRAQLLVVPKSNACEEVGHSLMMTVVFVCVRVCVCVHFTGAYLLLFASNLLDFLPPRSILFSVLGYQPQWFPNKRYMQQRDNGRTLS